MFRHTETESRRPHSVQRIECRLFAAAAAAAARNKHGSEVRPRRGVAPPGHWHCLRPGLSLIHIVHSLCRASVIIHCLASPLVKCHLHGVLKSAPCNADTVKQSRAYPVPRGCEETRSPARRHSLCTLGISAGSVERGLGGVCLLPRRGAERRSHGSLRLAPWSRGKIRLPCRREGFLSVEQAGERGRGSPLVLSVTTWEQVKRFCDGGGAY